MRRQVRATAPELAPDLTALAVWHAELSAACESPLLASVYMARLSEASRRLGELAQWFAALPRPMRRRLWRKWESALVVAALATVLGANGVRAASITVG